MFIYHLTWVAYYRPKVQFLYACKVLSLSHSVTQLGFLKSEYIQSDAFHTILKNQMPCNWILHTLLLNPTHSIPTSYHTIQYHPILIYTKSIPYYSHATPFILISPNHSIPYHPIQSHPIPSFTNQNRIISSYTIPCHHIPFE